MNNSINDLKNKKVVVTGGAGFIGSHLCEELVKIGANVISIDDYSAGKHENLGFLKDFSNFKISGNLFGFSTKEFKVEISTFKLFAI